MLQKEKEIGLQAVGTAMAMAATIQKEMTGSDTLTKTDRSPVTIADFAVQALICKILSSHFPGMPIVGEEDSLAMRQAGKPGIVRQDHPLPEKERRAPGGKRDLRLHRPGRGRAGRNVLDARSHRRHQGLPARRAIRHRPGAGPGRPGPPGHPRLPEPAAGSGGTLFWAIPGQGSWKIPAAGGSAEPIRASAKTDPRQMKFVESYESSHSDKDTQLEISRRLQISSPPEQMDSQVKYGIVAAGSADIYLRIPNPATPDYREKIWDHAAGSLIVEEAGGWVSDIDGKKLDFSAGKTLRHNRGILATNGRIHPRVLEIIAELAAKK